MINVASGHIQELGKAMGFAAPLFGRFIDQHGEGYLTELCCQYMASCLYINSKERPIHVNWNKAKGKWVVALHTEGSNKCFGSYDSMEFAGFVAWLAERHHLD